MRWLALCLVLVGCGIMGPDDETRIEMSWEQTDIGVTFYAKSQPPDTVFWEMRWFYDWRWFERCGFDADGDAQHALIWTAAPAELVVSFEAWGPRVKPKTIWYGHKADTP
jgi:hypothetical protein